RLRGELERLLGDELPRRRRDERVERLRAGAERHADREQGGRERAVDEDPRAWEEDERGGREREREQHRAEVVERAGGGEPGLLIEPGPGELARAEDLVDREDREDDGCKPPEVAVPASAGALAGVGRPGGEGDQRELGEAEPGAGHPLAEE